jgi:tetratricopeptide (TPR) repeat protein
MEKQNKDLPHWRQKLYEKGKAAAQRQNWDYAIEIFSQVLWHEPAFYECREALRGAQFKKAGRTRGFFRKLLGQAGNSSRIAKARLFLQSNPLGAIEAAETVLNHEPQNVAAHKLLAEAALEVDLPRTAVLSLEIAMRNSPGDKALALRLGEALVQAGQMKRAETVYTELHQAYPENPEIARVLKDVLARRTLAEGGYEVVPNGSGSYRDLLKDKEETVSLELEQREVKTEEVLDRMIREHEGRLALEPRDLNALRKLGDLYTKKQDFDRALEFYQRIDATENAGDPSLEKIISDLTARKMDREMAELDPDAPDYEERMAGLDSRRRTFILEECKRRAERYPADLQIRFELGQLYFEAEKIQEAIQEFQRAQAHPHRRIASLRYLGECFAKRGMDDLAARSLGNALKEKMISDEERKELLYLMGTVLEKQGQAEAALEQFKQIYATDIGYKDVVAKVDAYYAAS